MDDYICPACGQDINGPRYSAPHGMVCEECHERLWEEEFKDEEV